MSYLMMSGRRWYYRLVPKENKKGLLSDYPKAGLQNELVISMTKANTTKANTTKANTTKANTKDLRLYSLFTSYIQFAKFQLSIKEADRCFYEIIFGEQAQKPHFDIDIDDLSLDGNLIRDGVITSIIEVLREKHILLDLSRDLLIYTSHGKTKQSYHIVINNYCHLNNLEAKAFYEAVTKNLPSDISKWVDHAVYSKSQQFRVVGSQKTGSGRVKILNKEWTYLGRIYNHVYVEEPDDDNHEMLLQLEEGLVGFASGCITLPPFTVADSDKCKEYSETAEVTREDAMAAMELLAKAGNISLDDDRFPYKYDGIDGPFVILKRIKSSVCKLCHHTHDNQNPYLFVVGPERHVYFDCRRNKEGKKLYLGRLGVDEEVVVAPTETLNEKTINIGTSWTNDVVSRMKKLEHLSQSDVRLAQVRDKVKKAEKSIDTKQTSSIFQQAVQKISSGIASGRIQVATWDDDMF